MASVDEMRAVNINVDAIEGKLYRFPNPHIKGTQGRATGWDVPGRRKYNSPPANLSLKLRIIYPRTSYPTRLREHVKLSQITLACFSSKRARF